MFSELLQTTILDLPPSYSLRWTTTQDQESSSSTSSSKSFTSSTSTCSTSQYTLIPAHPFSSKSLNNVGVGSQYEYDRCSHFFYDQEDDLSFSDHCDDIENVLVLSLWLLVSPPCPGCQESFYQVGLQKSISLLVVLLEPSLEFQFELDLLSGLSLLDVMSSFRFSSSCSCYISLSTPPSTFSLFVISPVTSRNFFSIASCTINGGVPLGTSNSKLFNPSFYSLLHSAWLTRFIQFSLSWCKLSLELV